MPDIRSIRRRTRSVENTSKITRAMEMIAASKMRRAQQRVVQGRPYAEKMHKVLMNLAGQSDETEELHPLLQKRDVKQIQILLITPDRGLTGGLNGNINRTATQFMLGQKVPGNVVSIGRKGREFMTRHGQDVQASLSDFSDNLTVADILPISRLVTQNYTSGATDQIFLVYAEFHSIVLQKPVVKQLLPIETTKGEDQLSNQTSYIYEPNPAGVLTELLPRFVDMQIYQSMLEAVASEHSARMVAMRNATDSALEMVQSLTLELNKARQALITTELLDITGGVAALEA